MDIFRRDDKVNPVIIRDFESLSQKMRAFKVLFGRDPVVTFHGVIDDKKGDSTAWVDSSDGAKVTKVSPGFIRMVVDGREDWFDLSTAEEGFYSKFA